MSSGVLIPKLKEITGLPVYGIKEAYESKQDCMVECSKAELLEFVNHFRNSLLRKRKFKLPSNKGSGKLK